MGLPGTAKPSMAMKCMSQMATPPIDKAAMASHRMRVAVVVADAECLVHARPTTDPTTDTT